MYALLGDVVASRRLDDRSGAQRRIVEVLAQVARETPGVQPLQPTVGDEFQGAFASLWDAGLAALLIRLALLPTVDVRCGIWFGDATVFDDRRTPLLQDGPAWWAAREALATLGSARRSGARTLYSGPGADAANAHLLCRDALVDRLSDRGRRMLRMALRGATQQRIAEVEGITRSAVSQQFARGISAVRDAEDLLRRVT